MRDDGGDKFASIVVVKHAQHNFRTFWQNQTTIFCVRCGTQRGVVTHWLRAETHRDMAAWARSLVQGSHNAINFQREFSFRCMYQASDS